MKLVEGAFLLAVLIVLIEVPSQSDVPYIVFPVLIWAALRFGPVGAATAVAITSCLTVWNTAQGSGPFVRQSITHSVLASQLFVAVAALTSLVLAAVTAERSASQSAQEALTAEQAALRRIATLVASEAASAHVFEQVAAEAAQAGWRARGQSRTFRRGRHGHVRGWLESRPARLRFPSARAICLEETGVLAAVRATGEPQRIDRYEGLAGAVIERFTSFGYGSAVAAPVKLGGQVWGALVAAGPRGAPFAVGSERQLTDFAALVAQALANAEAYRSSRHHERGSSKQPTPNADGWSETCTTGRSNGSSRSHSSCSWSGRPCGETPRRRNRSRSRRRRSQAGARRTARARARHPPGALSDRGLAPLSGRLPNVRPSRSRSRGSQTRGCPMQSRRRSTMSSQKRSPMSQSTRTRRTQTSPSSDQTGSPLSSSATMASEVRQPGAGSGLVGLTDRVEALGGRLRLESTPGRGTRLSAQIPCD